jgi:Flp pilus assembly pilin Flp
MPPTKNLMHELTAVPREEGQGIIEYVLVAGVISMALFLAFGTSGIVGEIGNAVGRIVSTMAGS